MSMPRWQKCFKCWEKTPTTEAQKPRSLPHCQPRSLPSLLSHVPEPFSRRVALSKAPGRELAKCPHSNYAVPALTLSFQKKGYKSWSDRTPCLQVSCSEFRNHIGSETTEPSVSEKEKKRRRNKEARRRKHQNEPWPGYWWQLNKVMIWSMRGTLSCNKKQKVISTSIYWMTHWCQVPCKVLE